MQSNLAASFQDDDAIVIDNNHIETAPQQRLGAEAVLQSAAGYRVRRPRRSFASRPLGIKIRDEFKLFRVR